MYRALFFNVLPVMRIPIHLISYGLKYCSGHFFDNSIELCREHKDELLDAAIDKLKSSVKFRNFGVPINFLKVYDIVLTQDHRVILSLCLKDLS